MAQRRLLTLRYGAVVYEPRLPHYNPQGVSAPQAGPRGAGGRRLVGV